MYLFGSKMNHPWNDDVSYLSFSSMHEVHLSLRSNRLLHIHVLITVNTMYNVHDHHP